MNIQILNLKKIIVSGKFDFLKLSRMKFKILKNGILVNININIEKQKKFTFLHIWADIRAKIKKVLYYERNF